MEEAATPRLNGEVYGPTLTLPGKRGGETDSPLTYFSPSGPSGHLPMNGEEQCKS